MNKNFMTSIFFFFVIGLFFLNIGCSGGGGKTENVDPDTNPPSIPQDLRATAISETQIDLTWSSSSDNVAVIGYAIFRDDIEIGTVLETTFSDDGLLPDNTYQYSVLTYDAAGNRSARSESISVKTDPEPPTDFTAIINPSRTTCVAPCAVFFDATDSTGLADEDYVNANFEWSFSDPASSFPMSKGFVAAHLFKNPGTYNVRLSVKDSIGNTGSAIQNITVSEFEGTVYCVSDSGSDTSCNPGATALQTLDQVISEFDEVNEGSNKKFMFKRGESFNVNQTLQPLELNNMEFSTYGTGNKPVFIPGPSVSYIIQPASNVIDFRFIDIEVDGEGAANVQFLRNGNSEIQELLLWKVDIHNMGRGLNWQWSGAGLPNGPLYLIDSSLHDFLTNHNIYYTGHYLALINNTLSTALSHNMYLSSLYKGVITNNHFDGNGSSEDILRISNAGANLGLKGGDVVVSDNNFTSSDSSPWIYLHLGPNSARGGDCTEAVPYGNCAQNIENVLVERNKFFKGHIYGSQIAVGGGYSNLTIRNNIFEAQESGPTSLLIDDHNSRHYYYLYILSGTASQNINVYQNTFLSHDDDPLIIINNWANLGEEFCSNIWGCHTETIDDLNGEPTNHKNINIRNNIFYAESTGNFAVIETQAQGLEQANILEEIHVSNNLYSFSNNPGWQSAATNKDISPVIADPLFINRDGSDISIFDDYDLHLSSGSEAINAGIQLPSVINDFDGNDRPDGTVYDIGAYEFSE